MAPLCTLLIVAGAAVLPAQLYGESRPSAHYSEVTGTTRETLASWQRTGPDGYLLTSVSSNGDRHEVFVDKRLRTQWWTFRSPSRGIDIRATRRGDTIDVTGRLDGRPIARTLEIDSAPWYQSIERSLEPLAHGREGMKELFWVVEPYTLIARKIQARRGGVAELSVEGRRTRTAEVTISLPGFLSLFWQSKYWFRLSDGKFVRFEGLHGPPGSPLTVVKLTSETP